MDRHGALGRNLLGLLRLWLVHDFLRVLSDQLIHGGNYNNAIEN
jgi:hypothetical protein